MTCMRDRRFNLKSIGCHEILNAPCMQKFRPLNGCFPSSFLRRCCSAYNAYRISVQSQLLSSLVCSPSFFATAQRCCFCQWPAFHLHSPSRLVYRSVHANAHVWKGCILKLPRLHGQRAWHPLFLLQRVAWTSVQPCCCASKEHDGQEGS
jgi:hypothetical protein